MRDSSYGFRVNSEGSQIGQFSATWAIAHGFEHGTGRLDINSENTPGSIYQAQIRLPRVIAKYFDLCSRMPKFETRTSQADPMENPLYLPLLYPVTRGGSAGKRCARRPWNATHFDHNGRPRENFLISRTSWLYVSHWATECPEPKFVGLSSKTPTSRRVQALNFALVFTLDLWHSSLLPSERRNSENIAIKFDSPMLQHLRATTWCSSPKCPEPNPWLCHDQRTTLLHLHTCGVK